MDSESERAINTKVPEGPREKQMGLFTITESGNCHIEGVRNSSFPGWALKALKVTAVTYYQDHGDSKKKHFGWSAMNRYTLTSKLGI